MRVIVLGAGVTGLSVAYMLAKKGIDVIVLEKEVQIGGLAANVKRNNATFDFGPHTFFLQPEMEKEFYTVMNREEVNIFKAEAKVNYYNKYYQYPLDALDILLHSNPINTIMCFLDYLIAKAKMKLGSSADENAEKWIVNRFGKSLYKIYFENYTQKVWGLHPKFIAASFTEERIPVLSLRATFKNALKKVTYHILKQEGKIKSGYLSTGHYPKKGPATFFEKLSKRIYDNNGKIFLNAAIKKISLNKNKVESISYEQKNMNNTLKCDYVVSTIPINELPKLIIPRTPLAIYKTTESMKYRSVLFVNLLSKKSDILKARLVYFYNKTFNRISELNKFSNELIPEGLTGLCAEITCDKDDDIWNTDKKQLCDRVIAELEKEGLIAKRDIINSFVTQKEHGYPVADLNYEKNRKILYDYIGSIENLFVTGRQGLFRYLQMDHCMEMGVSVANYIFSGKHKCNINVEDMRKTHFV